MKKFVLIQEYYEPNTNMNALSKDRILEIRSVLNINLNNPLIHKIILLNECEYEYINEYIHAHDKLEVIITGHRLSFSMVFQYLLQTYDTHGDEIIIVSNNDIFLYDDESFNNINAVLLHDNRTVIALSRWEIRGSFITLFDSEYSQDTWIFVLPDKDVLERLIERTQFYFGLLACDNRIAYEFKQESFILRNIPYDVITVHNHRSNFRTYNNGTYLSGPITTVPIQRIIGPVVIIENEVLFIRFTRTT